MQLQEREKNIIAVFSVVAVFIIFFYVFKPISDKSSNLNKQITILRDDLGSNKISKKTTKDLRNKVDALKVEINDLMTQIPETEKRDFLIKDIEKLAIGNNIEIFSFIPKEAIPVTITGKEIDQRKKRYSKRQQASFEEQHAKVLKTIINIDSKGKFKNFSDFFAQLLSYYRAVEVSDLIITRSGVASKMGEDKRFSHKRRGQDPLEDAENMDLNVTFTLVAYTAITQ